MKYKPGTLTPATPTRWWNLPWRLFQHNRQAWPHLEVALFPLPWQWRLQFNAFKTEPLFYEEGEILFVKAFVGPFYIQFSYAGFSWTTPLSLRTEDEKYHYTKGGLQ